MKKNIFIGFCFFLFLLSHVRADGYLTDVSGDVKVNATGRAINSAILATNNMKVYSSGVIKIGKYSKVTIHTDDGIEKVINENRISVILMSQLEAKYKREQMEFEARVEARGSREQQMTKMKKEIDRNNTRVYSASKKIPNSRIVTNRVPLY